MTGLSAYLGFRVNELSANSHDSHLEPTMFEDSAESIRGGRLSRAPRPSNHRPLQDDSIRWAAYPRIAPGVYLAYCSWAKRYRDPGFKRWTCLLRWDVYAGDNLILPLARSVPLWFALGVKEVPNAPRRGKYLPEWVRANGGPPTKGDRLSPRVFTFRFARVEIGDAKSPVPYSVVKKVIEWETGIAGYVVNKSTSQGRPKKNNEHSGGYER